MRKVRTPSSLVQTSLPGSFLCGAGRLAIFFGQSWDRYDHVLLLFVDYGFPTRHPHSLVLAHQMCGCVNGKRLLALEIILIRASNTIVAAHIILIGLVFFQEFKEDEPRPSLQKVRWDNMQDPESL